MKILGGRVELHVFGEGRLRAAIEAEIGRLRIGRLVTLHGSVARPQEALRRVGLLVLPSSAEGFGLVLIEAMAAGVPVVATDIPAARHVLGNGRAGLLVPPGDPPALAAAIRRAVEQPALRASLARAGRAEVEERFTWERILPAYRTLLL